MAAVRDFLCEMKVDCCCPRLSWYKKSPPTIIIMRRRVAPCYHFFSSGASRQKTLSGTFLFIPFRCNRRSCRGLLFFQQRLSEAIFHLFLHIPSQRRLHGRDFSVVRCSGVLSSSTSFSYERIVTHFKRFVNQQFACFLSTPGIYLLCLQE